MAKYYAYAMESIESKETSINASKDMFQQVR